MQVRAVENGGLLDKWYHLMLLLIFVMKTSKELNYLKTVPMCYLDASYAVTVKNLNQKKDLTLITIQEILSTTVGIAVNLVHFLLYIPLSKEYP